MFWKSKYDVVITVAEEDLPVAEQIDAALKRLKISCYLYNQQGGKNWGVHLLRISLDKYGAQARCVLMIISKAYVKKYWSSIENQVVQISAHGQDAWLLPLRLDNTKVDALGKHIVYEEWKNNPDEIAEKIRQKLKDRKQRRTKKYLQIAVPLCILALTIITLSILTGNTTQKQTGDNTIEQKVDPSKLAGIVRMAGQAVSGVTVYTSFGTSITDELGRYVLRLDSCSGCTPGSELTIFTYHSEYGSSEVRCTISNDYRCNFNISRNPNHIIIIGKVESAATHEGIAGIDVSVLGNFSMDPTKTDRTGIFKIAIRKDQLERMNAVRLQVFDPERNYRPSLNNPQLYEITSFININMVTSRSYEISVSRIVQTTIYVREGDRVSIKAFGQISLGEFVGSSDPEGRPSGVLGFSLRSYNIVPHFNHAALMYRLEGDDQWRLAGRETTFIAQRSGHIQLQVNDNTQVDNDGSYEVQIAVNANEY